MLKLSAPPHTAAKAWVLTRSMLLFASRRLWVWAAQVGSWPTAGGNDTHLMIATDDSSLVTLDPESGESKARIPLGAM